MLSVGGGVGVVFGTAGLLFAALGVGLVIFMMRKVSEQKRTLREGAMAEARCLETFVVHDQASHGHGNSQRRLIIGFRTFDGRDVRATISSTRPYVAGDIVPVRYLPERPERALPVGEPSGLGLASCMLVGVCALFICVGLIFAALGFGMAAFADGSDGAGTGSHRFSLATTGA